MAERTMTPTLVYCLKSHALLFSGSPEIAARVARSHASTTSPVLVTENVPSWVGGK